MNPARRRPDRRGGRQDKPSRSDDSLLRRVGLGVLCVKVAAVPVVFDHAADASFIVPKALLSHGLSYVLIAVIVGIVILNGRSALLRSPLHWPALSFLSASVIATALSVNPTIALFGTHDRMLGLASIVDNVVTFVAAVELVRTRRDVIAILATTSASALVIIGYELIQLSGRDPLDWSIDGSQRPFSTVGQPTTLAQYLVTLSVVTFGFGALMGTLSRLIRGALLASSAVLLIAAGLTATRSIVLGVAAAAFVLVVLIWLKHPSARARQLSLLGGAGAAVLLLGILFLTPIGSRILPQAELNGVEVTQDPTFGPLEESSATRIAIYRMALGMVLDRPIFGYGPDNFA